MRHQWRFLAFTFGAVVLCAVLVTAQESATEKSEEKLAEIVVPQCRVKFVDQVVLASDRAGTLAFAPLEGETVKKGTSIAGLRDDVPQAALAVAEHEATNDVEVRYAEKASEVAEVEYRKALEANKRAAKAIPEVELLRLKLTSEKSVLQAEQAERDFKKAKLSRDQAAAELRAFRIDAPFSGVVTRVYKFAGEAVQMGDPIVEVVNPERLRVEGFVSVRDVREIAIGQRVKVQLEIPGEKDALSPEVLEGRVGFVDVSVQPVAHKVRVWAEVENHKGILRAGLTARMEIDTTSKPPSSIDTAAEK